MKSKRGRKPKKLYDIDPDTVIVDIPSHDILSNDIPIQNTSSLFERKQSIESPFDKLYNATLKKYETSKQSIPGFNSSPFLTFQASGKSPNINSPNMFQINHSEFKPNPKPLFKVEPKSQHQLVSEENPIQK